MGRLRQKKRNQTIASLIGGHGWVAKRKERNEKEKKKRKEKSKFQRRKEKKREK